MYFLKELNSEIHLGMKKRGPFCLERLQTSVACDDKRAGVEI